MIEIFDLVPDLETAYVALQEFYDVENESLFNFRRAELSDWIRRYIHCEIPQLRRAVETIRKYRNGIENAWHYHKSNSPTEGLNKRIKDIKRLAFGAHSFENFRKRALLACGYVHFTNEPFTVFGEKRGVAEDEKKGARHAQP